MYRIPNTPAKKSGKPNLSAGVYEQHFFVLLPLKVVEHYFPHVSVSFRLGCLSFSQVISVEYIHQYNISV